MANNCLLRKEPDQCKHNCSRCGFNVKEAEHRNKTLSENGLTVCEDGLERLIIKREVSEE